MKKGRENMLTDTSGMLSAQFIFRETLRDTLVSSTNQWGKKQIGGDYRDLRVISTSHNGWILFESWFKQIEPKKTKVICKTIGNLSAEYIFSDRCYSFNVFREDDVIVFIKESLVFLKHIQKYLQIKWYNAWDFLQK